MNKLKRMLSIIICVFSFNLKASANITSLNIVCYGDSNTQGFYGNTYTDVELENSYPGIANNICKEFKNIANAKFIRKGNPGGTSSDAITRFDEQVKLSDANVVILGWGTNDIRENSDYTNYINNMEILIKKSLDLKATPIVLSIPDFSETYAGEGEKGLAAKARIKVWNKKLYDLCMKYNIKYIDTYAMFNNSIIDNHTIWYNDTPWRHFSKYANQMIAYKICELLNSEYRINN